MRNSKTSFFTALERLDDPDDSQDDEVTSLENLLTTSRSKRTPDKISAISTSAGPLSLRRANTEPQSSSTKSDLQTTGDLRRSTTTDELKVTTVQRAQTTTARPGAKTGGGPRWPAGPARKKRKVDPLNRVPSDQQIFKGLVFCKTFSVLSLSRLSDNRYSFLPKQ